MDGRTHHRRHRDGEAAFAARLLAFLFAAGGALGLLVVALPHPDAMDEAGVLAVASVACALAAVLGAAAGRLANRAIPSVVTVGTVLITAAVHSSGEGTTAFALFYVWVGLFVFYFLTRTEALVQVALIAVAYGAALYFGFGGAGSFTTLWLLTVGTMLVAGTLVGRLVGQVRAQAADLEAVARASRRVSGRYEPSNARQTICEAARDVAAAAAAVLFEPDRPGGLLICSAASEGEAPRLRLPLDDRSYGAVAAFLSGSPRFIADLSADARLRRPLRNEMALGSCLCQPVIQDGVAVGVLVVVWERRVKRIPGRLASVTALLAAEAASAIERGDLLARLEAAAKTDELTGVGNRRALHEELSRELGRAARDGGPLCAALIDLDRFKMFNDERGHQAGDELLREAAAAWSAVLRPTDVLARYGGEEFVVILPSCGPKEAYRLAERLRAAMPGAQTCSVGIACWDGDETAEALIHRTDVALYEAKRSGRNRSVIAPTTTPALV